MDDSGQIKQENRCNCNQEQQGKWLSVIIPMYNAGPFIKKCLDSMILGEAGMNALEVLVVDDGSTDGACVVVENYVRRWPQTFRLLKKKNAGHGSAVNLGVSCCTGRYLKVVDADDWVQTEELGKMLKLLQRIRQMDAVLCGYRILDIRSGKVQNIRAQIRQPLQKETAEDASLQGDSFACLTLGEVMRDWDNYKRLFCLHGLIYGTDFYRSMHRDLPEHVSYDDAYFDVVYASRSDRLCAADLSVYVYRTGDPHQSVSSRNRAERIRDLETVLLRILKTAPHADSHSKAGRAYWYRRICPFLTDYFITAFLRVPNRRKGRLYASRFYRKLKTGDPGLWRMIRKKYMLLKVMGLLHIRDTWLTKLLELKACAVDFRCRRQCTSKVQRVHGQKWKHTMAACTPLEGSES